ncbi:MAG: MFS transporter [Gammaproteobacteria bacterium]|nr:MFS transporter [Gammaproteobacteria bacterium]MDH4315341.1 MFS transporter [Gammaproteobacteria bacterium]MDH5215428.1 MFS transporter [Gammaproteobacteria bacterium]MDH5501898.1 MFS transporter [Gammaproteobacteria bacterium]
MSASSRPTIVRWRVLGLLVISSFVSYVLRYNVSTAGPSLIDDLGITEIQYGWVLAAFTAGYAIFQFPSGLLGVAWGHRRTLATAMVLWGLLTILTSVVPGPDVAGVGLTVASLIVVRFLVGAVHAPIYPITGGVVERWFPVGHWGLPNGLSSTGLTLGTAATASVLVWMIDLQGWRQSFLMLAPLGFLAAWAWWWYFRDNPEEHKSVNAAEVALITADRPAATEESSGEPAWLRVLKNRNALLLAASYFCMNYVFFQMFNWVFYYFVEVRGFEAQQAGFFTSIQWIAAAVGATLGGFLCDYVCQRKGLCLGCRWPAAIAVFLSGVFILIGSLPVGAGVAVACFAASFFFNQITEAAYWAAAIGIGGRYSAATSGIMNTGGNSVGFVNALLVPFTAQILGWTVAMATAAGFAFLAAILWMFIRADERIAD